MQYSLINSGTRFLSTENYKITQFPDGFRLNIRGSQWGGVFYGYRLKFWLFYGYRLIFCSYG